MARGASTVPRTRRTRPGGFRSLSPEELSRFSQERSLGFSGEELAALSEHFRAEGRDPSDLELAGIAQSWSEHCSYKSSRPILSRHFGPLPVPPRVLARGDAGVVALDEEWAYALRIESHNHPSAIEPYGGAATGIGGILRDVLAMGGKPVALADPLFFGPLDPGRTRPLPGIKPSRYLFQNVVAGIRDYGNRVGVPTVAGSLTFDSAYRVNPLVNVACVGLLPRSRLLPNRASRAGQHLVLVGGLTGRDGIGGVAFASRELSSKSEEESRGAVQLGNPILKEPLIHACLEAADEKLIAGMKDLGGGGLSSASGELVHAGGFGSEIHLERVPLRETGLAPWEIWVSESQERMILAVEPPNLPRLRAIFERWEVPLAVVGTVTEGDRERIFYRGKRLGDLPLSFRLEPPPPRLDMAPPSARAPDPLPPAPSDLSATLEELLLSENGCSREGVVRLYDHEVQGRTVGKPLTGRPDHPTHADAAVLQVSANRALGIALAVGSQPFLCAYDAERGGSASVEEAAANLYAVGARPDSLTDCLNFGNPNDPTVLGDFDRVVAGIARACASLGISVPSGNVSFYNGGLGASIPPTPVVLTVGVVPDISRMMSSDLKSSGNALYLLGPEVRGLTGSNYQRRFGGPGGGFAAFPGATFPACGEGLLRASEERLVEAVHDVSEGGLSQTLVEMAFGGKLGFSVDLEQVSGEGIPSWVKLFAEGGPRWVVEVRPDHEEALRGVLRGLPFRQIGRVEEAGGLWTEGDRRLAELDLERLYPRWQAGFYPRPLPAARP